MLASIIMHFRPLEKARLGKTPERSLHALFLELVREADEEIAAKLHKAASLKPFTVSPLRGKLTWQDERPLVSPEETYKVRFTTLSEEALAPFNYSVTGHYIYKRPLTLDGVPFVIEDVLLTPERSQGWARLSSYEVLYQEAGDERSITLGFFSPTTFRTGDVNLLFPLSVSVFGSLYRKWQAFSGIPLDEGLMDFVEKHVVEERYRLATKVVKYGPQYQLNGFVGRCRYRILGKDRRRVRELNLLADFALFAGVGQKTTMGMGQCKRIKRPMGQ